MAIKQGYYDKAIYCHADHGPRFGGGTDIFICCNSNNSNSYTSLDHTY